MKLAEHVAQLAAIGAHQSEQESDIDRQIARETACEHCGRTGLIYRAFRDADSRYIAAIAYCPNDYEAISF